MKDYVLREDVLRCVEEAGHDNELDLGYPDHNEAFQEIIKDIPAAEVRPVVLCKDCRHRDPECHKCDCGQFERAGCVFPVDDDYFCAYGER